MVRVGISNLFEHCVLPRVISPKKREAVMGEGPHQQGAAEANFTWSPA